MALQPGLYNIIHVLNKELGLMSFASAHSVDGTPVVGSPIVGSTIHTPNLISDWRVRLVDDSDDLYTIEALSDPTLPPPGFTTKEIKSNAPVLYDAPPRALRIQPVPEEDQGPDAHAYSIMVPVDTDGTLFYMRQRNTKEANPPVELVAILDAPIPYWIFKPIFLD